MYTLKNVNTLKEATDIVSPLIERVRGAYRLQDVQLQQWTSKRAYFEAVGWHGKKILMEVHLDNFEIYVKPAEINTWVYLGNLRTGKL